MWPQLLEKEVKVSFTVSDTNMSKICCCSYRAWKITFKIEAWRLIGNFVHFISHNWWLMQVSLSVWIPMLKIICKWVPALYICTAVKYIGSMKMQCGKANSNVWKQHTVVSLSVRRESVERGKVVSKHISPLWVISERCSRCFFAHLCPPQRQTACWLTFANLWFGALESKQMEGSGRI